MSIDELTLRTRLLPDGEVLTTRLGAGDPLTVVESGPAGESRLPLAADLIVGAFARYGRPLEAVLPPRAADDLALEFVTPDGRPAALRAFEYRAPVDVIANDWLLLEVEGDEALAAAAPLIGPALVALARAASAARDPAKTLKS